VKNKNKNKNKKNPNKRKIKNLRKQQKYVGLPPSWVGLPSSIPAQ
jgi:hypothetical protein